MPTSKRDRTTGLPLPDPVVPLTSVCFQISVPNALEYRSALKGALSVLGQAWTWSQTAGEDNQAAYEAAELWRARIADSLYLLDCEATVDCNDVADCINTNASVQRAVSNVAGTVATPGTTSVPGIPMTSAQASAPLNPLVGCNLDELWAQCEQLVDYVIQAALDMMEKIEAYTNTIEAVQFVEMVPILGTLFDEAQLDKVVQFLDWLPEVAAEILAAADTPEARELIKCAIFCACKADCIISIDRLWEVENVRLGGALNPSSIDTVEKLIETIVALGTNPALPLDVWFTFTIAMAKLAGYLGVRGIDFSLTLLLKLAVNDANNDWELLCTDCATPPVDDCQNFLASDGNWYAADASGAPNSAYGLRISGEGFAPNQTNQQFFLARTVGPDQEITGVQIKFNEAVTGVYLYSLDSGGSCYYTGSDISTVVFDLSSDPDFFPKNLLSNRLAITFTGNLAPNMSTRLTEFCVLTA